MSELPHEIHNRLAPELLNRIVRETPREGDRWMVVESIVLGLLMVQKTDDPISAALFLEEMTKHIVDRLKT